MLRLLIFSLLIGQLYACSTPKALVKDGPVITFDDEVLDIGQLTKGESHTLFFNFTNTGNQDLALSLIHI